MTAEIAVVTDWSADLPSGEELKKRHKINPLVQIPFDVTFGEKTYNLGKNLDNQLFKKLLGESKDLPLTAAYGPEYFEKVYDELLLRHRSLAVVLIDSKMSSTLASAVLAAREKRFRSSVVVHDSGSVSMGLGIQAIRMAQAAEQGANLADVIQVGVDVKKRTFLRAATPNINFLARNGRVSNRQLFVASLLNITPILQIDHGETKSIAKTQTRRQLVEWMADFVIKNSEDNIPEQVSIMELDTKPIENVQNFITEIIRRGVPENRIYRGDLGPVAGVWGGLGTWGVVKTDSE